MRVMHTFTLVLLLSLSILALISPMTSTIVMADSSSSNDNNGFQIIPNPESVNDTLTFIYNMLSFVIHPMSYDFRWYLGAVQTMLPASFNHSYMVIVYGPISPNESLVWGFTDTGKFVNLTLHGAIVNSTVYYVGETPYTVLLTNSSTSYVLGWIYDKPYPIPTPSNIWSPTPGYYGMPLTLLVNDTYYLLNTSLSRLDITGNYSSVYVIPNYTLTVLNNTIMVNMTGEELRGNLTGEGIVNSTLLVLVYSGDNNSTSAYILDHGCWKSIASLPGLWRALLYTRKGVVVATSIGGVSQFYLLELNGKLHYLTGGHIGASVPYGVMVYVGENNSPHIGVAVIPCDNPLRISTYPMPTRVRSIPVYGPAPGTKGEISVNLTFTPITGYMGLFRYWNMTIPYFASLVKLNIAEKGTGYLPTPKFAGSHWKTSKALLFFIPNPPGTGIVLKPGTVVNYPGSLTITAPTPILVVRCGALTISTNHTVIIKNMSPAGSPYLIRISVYMGFTFVREDYLVYVRQAPLSAIVDISTGMLVPNTPVTIIVHLVDPFTHQILDKAYSYLVLHVRVGSTSTITYPGKPVQIYYQPSPQALEKGYEKITIYGVNVINTTLTLPVAKSAPIPVIGRAGNQLIIAFQTLYGKLLQGTIIIDGKRYGNPAKLLYSEGETITAKFIPESKTIQPAVIEIELGPTPKIIKYELLGTQNIAPVTYTTTAIVHSTTTTITTTLTHPNTTTLTPITGTLTITPKPVTITSTKTIYKPYTSTTFLITGIAVIIAVIITYLIARKK